MIYIFHAQNSLLTSMSETQNERNLVQLVINHLDQYEYATSVKHSELDIAFAATGGPTAWVNVDNMSVDFHPVPKRTSEYGDILVEAANGFVNLSTPAGFIPLVDVIEQQGNLRRKTFN